MVAQAEPGRGEDVGDGAEGSMIAEADPSYSLSSEGRALQDVFFGYDSWRISEEAKDLLQHNAALLKNDRSKQVAVEGHCDERGSSAYNLVLGEKRARAVRNYLVELGVRPHRVKTVSYGKERPFCSGHDEACYRLNRRGHMTLSTR